MFFAFKENLKISKQDSEIKSLSDRVEELEREIFYLKNPPSFKVGDLVTINHVPGDNRGFAPVEFALTEERELDTFIVTKVLRKKEEKSMYFGPRYLYSYEIIDRNFKKHSLSFDEDMLKPVQSKKGKKR